MSAQRGIWKKGKKTIKGTWEYIWHRDRFLIQLDGKDPVTDMRRESFEVAGDGPDFGKWKLVEKKEK